jgi:C4-dicarboxylate transporter DctM subunit
MVVMVVELGMIMPPIGINVFVINSLARDVPLWTIYKGVMPFILSDFVRLAILVAFPILSTFLPSRM